MSHTCTIAGREVELRWNQETAKRFAFRMGQCGGEPTGKDFTNPRTVSTALFKALWALLPVVEFQKYPDPESLYVAVDHDEEAEGIFAAVNAIYQERFADPEKKSTSKNSPSPESNSA